MSGEFGGSSFEEEKENLEVFSIRQSSEGKFIAILPYETIELSEDRGLPVININGETCVEKTFETEAEARDAADEAKNSLDEF